MTPDQIQALFTRPAASADAVPFRFARWGRPIVPVIFGLDDATLAIFKGAIEAMVAVAGHHMAETDPELGANVMIFFCRDWAELTEVPNLEKLLPGLSETCAKLTARQANQYRSFRFDEQGAIRAVFVFLRMDQHLSEMPASDLALSQAAQAMLSWADGAFSHHPLLAQDAQGEVLLHPEIAALIQAAYDPLLPAVSNDASHALRLFARLARPEPATR